MNNIFAIFSKTGLRWLWLTILFLVIDQVSKQWVVASFDLYESVELLPIFNFTYVHNLGAAFSFLADQSGWQRWFFTTISTVASIVFIIWLTRIPKAQILLSIAVALMLSGSLGNLIDRALFGYVIDFLDFHLADKHFPAFNVADSMIFIGASLMIVDAFLQDKNAK